MTRITLALIPFLIACNEPATRPSQTAATQPATTQAETVPAELRGALITGRWIKDLGDPRQYEGYFYTFSPNGTYRSEFLTDFTPPVVTGKWELRRDPSGSVRLRLYEQKGKKDYYWLGEDSQIRYDKQTDSLLISGQHYAGEPRLRHETAGK